MSKVLPFPALLPRADLAALIACPPYDVLTSEEARALAADNPHSLLHVTKAEIDFPPGVGEDDDRTPKRARENLDRFLREEWFHCEAASFYAYRIEWRGRAQTGLVAAVSVDEYDAGLIRRHEKTRREKEDDRTRLALALSAHAEPVLLACRSSDGIKKVIAASQGAPPLFDVTDGDGARHRLWRAGNTQEIAAAFAASPALYIADGHHRSATASRVREALQRENPRHTGTEPYNFFPAVIFPHDELCVYRYGWEGPGEKRPMAEVTIEEIMALADRGGIMPPKSTWFAPKLLSGLFVYAF